MKLWVRSQKGGYVNERLIKVDDIALEYVDDDTYCIVVNNGVEVAYYHSEERALEVLNEIQDFIENDGAYDRVVDYEINEYASKVHYEQRKIYEMPQEREEK